MHIHSTALIALLLLPALSFADPITIQAGSLGINEDWCPGVPEWFTQQAASFTAANPDINVDLLGLGEPSRDRLPIQDVPVLARNVIGIDAVSGYEAAWLVSRGDIVPIDGFLPDPEFNKDDFYDNLWPPVTFDGKIWAVPLVAAPLLFAYRTDLLQTAGVTQPPKTWEDLLACATAVAANTSMPAGLRPLYTDDIEQVILTMLIQQGDGLMRDNKFDVAIDQINEAIQLARPILSMDADRYRGDRSLDLAAMVIGSPGLINDIPRATRPKWRLAPLPTSGKNIQAPYQVIYLAVRSATPEYQTASWKFIKWLLRTDAPLPASPVPMPCRKSFAQKIASENPAAYLFQDIQLLWTSIGQIQDYGPNNLFNRRDALETLADAAGQLFESPQNQSLPEYSEILLKANNQLTPIDPPSRAPYALYR